MPPTQVPASPYPFPYDSSFTPETTALALIDMQRDCHRPDLCTLSPREAFRSCNNPPGLGIGDAGPLGRLLIRGEPGHDIIPELYPIEGEVVIDKPGKSAFAHTDFELILRNRGVRNLVIAGVTTDVCVSSTMREASDRGFDCLLVGDCTEAAQPELREGTIETIKSEGGVFGAVGTLADVLAVIERLGGRREATT